MNKLTEQEILQLKTDKYNMDLVLKHLQRLETTIKKVKSQLINGHKPERKLQNIETIIQEIEEFI